MEPGAKCAILNSLGENVFNRVFTCENAKVLWKTISENHEGTKDVANERYHVLIDKLKAKNGFGGFGDLAYKLK